MGFLKVLSVLLVISCAFAEEENLPEACAVEDIPCFNKFIKEYLKHTAGGVPNFGLKAIGPPAILPFEITTDDATADYKNLKATGLKNEEIVDVKMNKEAKTLTIARKQNVKIEGDLDLTFNKKSEKYSSKLSATADALMTVIYDYELKTDDKGEQHFHVRSNTFKCRLSSIKLDLGEELALTAEAPQEKVHRKLWEEQAANQLLCIKPYHQRL